MLIEVFTSEELTVVEFVKALVLLVDVPFVVFAVVAELVLVVDDCVTKTLKERAPYATAITSKEAMAIEPTIAIIALRDVCVLSLIA